MSVSRSTRNRITAAALAIAIGAAAGPVVAGESFSALPSAHAQTQSSRSVSNLEYRDTVLPVIPGERAAAVVSDWDKLPWGTEFTHDAPAGWDMEFESPTSRWQGTVKITAPANAAVGNQVINVTAAFEGETRTVPLTVKVLAESERPIAWGTVITKAPSAGTLHLDTSLNHELPEGSTFRYKADDTNPSAKFAYMGGYQVDRFTGEPAEGRNLMFSVISSDSKTLGFHEFQVDVVAADGSVVTETAHAYVEPGDSWGHYEKIATAAGTLARERGEQRIPLHDTRYNSPDGFPVGTTVGIWEGASGQGGVPRNVMPSIYRIEETTPGMFEMVITVGEEFYAAKYRPWIRVTYPDGTIGGNPYRLDLGHVFKYAPTTVDAGTTVTIESNNTFPSDTVFSLQGESADLDWVTVDSATGAVTLNVPEGMTKETLPTISVEASYDPTLNPDAHLDTTPVEDRVSGGTAILSLVMNSEAGTGNPGEGAESDLYDPQYVQDTTVPAGGTETVPAPTGVPDTATFGPGTDVPEWATIDPDTGSISVTPGVDVTPDDYAVNVVVTYEDGTTDNVDVAVKVTDNEAGLYAPAYAAATVEQGHVVELEAPVDNVNALPEGTTFARTGTTPAWVTVSDNGVLTLAPTVTDRVGVHTVPVRVTYPDSSSETLTAKVTVTEKSDNDSNDPSYGAVSVDKGATATAGAPKNSDGTDLPDGTKYTAGEGAPAWATVNPDGTVTLAPGGDVDAGPYPVAVDVTYPDGTSDNLVLPVTVTEVVLSSLHDPDYVDTAVVQGEQEVIAAPANPDGRDLPAGTTFTSITDLPAWASLDEDGSITVAPGFDVEAGTRVFEVTVTYPDGSEDVVDVTVEVVDKVLDSDLNDPDYGDIVAEKGTETVVPAPTNPDGSDVPDGSEFAPGEGNPDWVTVNPDGTLTLTPGDDVEPGDYPIKVEVSYPDGSTDIIDSVVTVKDEPAVVTPEVDSDADTYAPGYDDVDAPRGAETVVESPKDVNGKDLPEGIEYEGKDNPDWVTVNPDGSLVMTPGDDVELGDHIVTVTVTYPDGSAEVIDVLVSVVDGDGGSVPVDEKDSGDGILANTGAGVLGLVAAGLAALVGGAGLITRRNRG